MVNDVTYETLPSNKSFLRSFSSTWWIEYIKCTYICQTVLTNWRTTVFTNTTIFTSRVIVIASCVRGFAIFFGFARLSRLKKEAIKSYFRKQLTKNLQFNRILFWKYFILIPIIDEIHRNIYLWNHRVIALRRRDYIWITFASTLRIFTRAWFHRARSIHKAPLQKSKILSFHDTKLETFNAISHNLNL